MKKVYICGWRDEEEISDATRERFAKAEEMLKEMGLEPFNPINEKWVESLKKSFLHDKKIYSNLLNRHFPPLRTYMALRNLMALATKDAIYMLDGWGVSDIAGSELRFSRFAGIQRIWEKEEDSRVFRDSSGNYADTWLPLEG